MNRYQHLAKARAIRERIVAAGNARVLPQVADLEVVVNAFVADGSGLDGGLLTAMLQRLPRLAVEERSIEVLLRILATAVATDPRALARRRYLVRTMAAALQTCDPIAPVEARLHALLLADELCHDPGAGPAAWSRWALELMDGACAAQLGPRSSLQLLRLARDAAHRAGRERVLATRVMEWIRVRRDKDPRERADACELVRSLWQESTTPWRQTTRKTSE
jgi:hypothetical protein